MPYRLFAPRLAGRLATLVALLAASVCVSPAAGDAVVPEKYRVKNKDSGWCVWCSVATLAGPLAAADAKNESLAKAAGVVEARAKVTDKGPATPAEAETFLTGLGVRFASKGEGAFDAAFLRKATDAKVGAVVGLRNWPTAGESHAVAVLSVSAAKTTFAGGQDDFEVTFIDSNDPSRVMRASLGWLAGVATGWMLVLDAEAPKDVAKPVEGKPVEGKPVEGKPVERPTPRTPAVSGGAAHAALVARLVASGMKPAEADKAAVLLATTPPRRVPPAPPAPPAKDKDKDATEKGNTP